MSDRVVVDTSLAIKWVILEPHTTEAKVLLADWSARQVLPVVPSWLACEVANVVYQRVREDLIPLIAAKVALNAILEAVTIRDYEQATVERSIELAHMLGQRASYDAHNLAIAEHLDCELWTADRRFWDAAKRAFPRVRWIGELAANTDNTAPG